MRPFTYDGNGLQRPHQPYALSPSHVGTSVAPERAGIQPAYNQPSSDAAYVRCRLRRAGLAFGLVLACGVLLIYAWLLTIGYDFNPIIFYMKAQLMGQDVSDCLSLPEHIWRLLPQCGGGPTNGYGYGLTDR